MNNSKLDIRSIITSLEAVKIAVSTISKTATASTTARIDFNFTLTYVLYVSHKQRDVQLHIKALLFWSTVFNFDNTSLIN